jgi:hypothetical protein
MLHSYALSMSENAKQKILRSVCAYFFLDFFLQMFHPQMKWELWSTQKWSILPFKVRICENELLDKKEEKMIKCSIKYKILFVVDFRHFLFVPVPSLCVKDIK